MVDKAAEIDISGKFNARPEKNKVKKNHFLLDSGSILSLYILRSLQQSNSSVSSIRMQHLKVWLTIAQIQQLLNIFPI